MPSVELASKRQAAREVIDILSEISVLLVRIGIVHMRCAPLTRTEYPFRS